MADLVFVMANVGLLTDEMRHLLDARKIVIGVQAAIGELGLTTVNLFALLGDDIAMVRDALSSPPFDLDPAAADITPAQKLKRRVDQAKVLDAWEAARARAGEKRKTEAVQRSTSLPLTMASGDQVNPRCAYEGIFGTVEDECYPAMCVIERRMQEVEQGNSTAESLQDVPNLLETVADTGGVILDLDGTFKVKRGSHRVPLPADSEALRRRVRLLGVSYALSKIQNPTRVWLSTATQEVWLDHLDYVLGPRVSGMKVAAVGREIAPSWAVVLDYEWALRRNAIKMVVYEGKDFKEAMVAARRCTELRETHFVTPAIIGAVSAATTSGYGPVLSPTGYGPAPSHSAAPPPWHPYDFENKGSEKGKGKKGKGKAKGKGFDMDPSLARNTADGKPICFAYNTDRMKCKDGKNCRRVHVCRRCFGSHPFHLCKGPAGGSVQAPAA